MPPILLPELVMRRRRLRPGGYVIAIVLTIAAAALTRALPALLAPMRLFFFWVAVFLSSLMGIGPAALAIALAAGAIAFVVFDPVGSFSVRSGTDVARLLMFIVFAGGISMIAGLRKRAEERTIALRDWLATTLRSIADAVVAVDDTNRIIFMNASAEALTGREAAGAAGQPFDDVVHIVDESTRERLSINDVANREQVLLISRDGRETAIADSASPIVGDRGVPLGTVLVFRDISSQRELERSRQQARDDLRAAAATYRTLAEASPTAQAIWTASAAGEIEWADRWLEITGQTRQEVEADGGLSVVYPEDATRTSERWRHALESGNAYEDEIRVRVVSGRYRWFAIRAVPVMESGSIVRWVGAVTDIHERRRHEFDAELINRASAILGSSLDFEVTLRSLAKLCVPELADWCAVDVARDAEPYERLAVEHLDPAKIDLAFDFHRRYRLLPEVDPVVKTLETGASQIVEEIPDELLVSLARDEEHLRSARELGLKSWIMVPMAARGGILGVLTLISAESGRRYSAEDLPLIEELGRRAGTAIDNARLYREAEEANRAKDEFLATLSHELRTPLTAITGWASMLQMGELDDATTSIAIDTIARSAKVQGELIDDLLDLSRVVAGKLELTIEDVDLWSIASDVIAAAKPAAEARKIGS